MVSANGRTIARFLRENSDPVAASRPQVVSRRQAFGGHPFVSWRAAAIILLGWTGSNSSAEPPSWVTPASWQADAAEDPAMSLLDVQTVAFSRGGSGVSPESDVRFDRIDDQTVWTIQTMPAVTVSGANVRLRDVARLVGLPQGGWDRIGQHVLAIIPASGGTVTLDRSRVAALIEMLPASPKRFRWVGAERISVLRNDAKGGGPPADRFGADHRGQAVSDAPFLVANATRTETRVQPTTATETLTFATGPEQKRLEDLLSTHLERTEPNVLRWGRIVRVRWPQAFSNCSGIASVQWLRGDVLPWNRDLDPGTRTVSNETDAPVQTVVAIVAARFPQGRFGGGGVREVVCEVDLRANPLRWTVARAVGREHVLRREDLRLQAVSVDAANEGIDASMSSMASAHSDRGIEYWIGKRTLTSLRRGQPLSEAVVGKPRWVHRGETVEVRSETAAIVVTAVGRCLEDGGEDDWVEIETVSPRKRLTAQVIGAGVVRVLARSPRTGSNIPAKAEKR